MYWRGGGGWGGARDGYMLMAEIAGSVSLMGTFVSKACSST